MAYAPTFTDTFSGYNTLQGARELWTSCVGSGAFGVGNLGVGNSVLSPATWQKTLTAGNGWIISAHVAFGPLITANAEVFRLVDQNGALIVSVTRLTTGVVQVVTGGASSITANSATAIVATAYHKIDVGFLYATGAGLGRLEVRIDGIRENSLTSTAFGGGTLAAFAITGSPAPLQPKALIIGNTIGAQTVTWDAVGVQQDTVVWPDPNSGFINNRSKFILRPDADSTFVPGSNWVVGVSGASGPAVFQAVNELSGDMDASYITTNIALGGGSALDRCSWKFGSVPTNTTSISWVAHTQQVRSAPSGTLATINTFLYNGATSDGVANAIPSDAAYHRIQDHYTTEPGGLPWNKVLINAVDGGVRITSLS